MIIRLAQHSGYCFGVKRAIGLALDAAQDGKTIYTLGPIIHNPQIVKSLESKGIVAVEDISGVRDSVVVIRSHGITRQELETLQSNGNTIIDATCPYVKRTHEIVSNLVAESYPIMILGDEQHPEIIAMLSYGNDDTTVVTKDLEIGERRWQKLGLLSQTTQNEENLKQLVQKLLTNTSELRVFNTICCATNERQDATKELAKCSDLMIVIGGKNSSNTKMLAKLCSCVTTCVHVETADEIHEYMFCGKSKIGLTAGASTPDYMIISVFNKIKEIYGEMSSASKMEDIPLFKEESC